MAEHGNEIPITRRVRLPVEELVFRFSTSGGPGGQHANRSATRVTLRFDVAGSPALAAQLGEAGQQQLVARLAERLDGQGHLQITVQETRSQFRNRATAVRRLQLILAEALQPRKKRRPTAPSQAARQRRREAKRKRSARKRERRWRYEE